MTMNWWDVKPATIDNRHSMRIHAATITHSAPRKWRVRLEWKIQDLWIGAFWRRTPERFDLWICLVPCLPIHISKG